MDSAVVKMNFFLQVSAKIGRFYKGSVLHLPGAKMPRKAHRAARGQNPQAVKSIQKVRKKYGKNQSKINTNPHPL